MKVTWFYTIRYIRNIHIARATALSYGTVKKTAKLSFYYIEGSL